MWYPFTPATQGTGPFNDPFPAMSDNKVTWACVPWLEKVGRDAAPHNGGLSPWGNALLVTFDDEQSWMEI
ncbi:hypothetical protein PIIN_03667 [Serendipita indica DSM 11827]|uniref:Uncharacterized protein n=1 Tax=Serendipita indica (strain DSM 11827) TaxID=1109443 RepID=G4TEI3_SERID|nr:hypothetical protein PIIN_03667 [Serendipita indica DSM 11827]